MVQYDILWATVRAVTDRKGAGPDRRNDLDSRKRDPVIEVLCRKHPETRAPRSRKFDDYEGEVEPNSLGIYCYEEDVAT